MRKRRVPVSKLTRMRAAALFTLVGLATLVAMVGLSFWMLERTRTSTEEVIATREMRSALVDRFSIIQDAETGQRGYMLTGEARYLEPYQDAVERTDVSLKKLEQVIRRQPGADAFVADLKAAIDTKMAELAQTVDLKRTGKSDEALAIVLDDGSKITMDRIRSLIHNERNKVEARLFAAIDSQRENANALRWMRRA